MLWILVDVAIALLALTGLGIVGLRLWRTVKQTSRALGDANERLATAQNALEAAQRQSARDRPSHARER